MNLQSIAELKFVLTAEYNFVDFYQNAFVIRVTYYPIQCNQNADYRKTISSVSVACHAYFRLGQKIGPLEKGEKLM